MDRSANPDKRTTVSQEKSPQFVIGPNGATKGPLLTRIVETRKLENWKDQERSMRDNVWLLTLAGHDTTAATMSWCLYELARHPKHMKKAQAEVDVFSQISRRKDVMVWSIQIFTRLRF